MKLFEDKVVPLQCEKYQRSNVVVIFDHITYTLEFWL